MSHVRNTGKASEAIFEAFWEAKGKAAYLERRIDLAHVRGLNPDLKGIKLPPQPSDYVLTHNGTTCYCEVKSSNNRTSFPLSQFEDGQWAAMRRVTAAGGTYLIFIHNKVEGDWYCLTGSFVLNWPNGKSIPWYDMRHHKWFLT